MEEYGHLEQSGSSRLVMLTLKRNQSISTVPLEVNRTPRVVSKAQTEHTDRLELIQVQNVGLVKPGSTTMTSFRMTHQSSEKRLPFLHRLSKDSHDGSASMSRRDLSKVQQLGNQSPSEFASSELLSKTLRMTQGKTSNLFEALKKRQLGKFDEHRGISFLKDRMGGSTNELAKVQKTMIEAPNIIHQPRKFSPDLPDVQPDIFSQLPDTIDVARATLEQAGYPRYETELLNKIEILRRPLEERIANRRAHRMRGSRSRSEKSPPKIVLAPKKEPDLKTMVESAILERKRQKVSMTRLELGKISTWVKSHMQPAIKEFGTKTGGSDKHACVQQMKHVVDFGYFEFERVLGTLSGTVKELFRELRKWEHKTQMLGETIVQEFLDAMEDIHMEHIMEYNEAKDLEMEDLRIEIRGLDFRLKNKGYELDDRAEVIRKLKNKLTTYNYGLRFTKMELKHVEELNQIITKENDIITGIIHETLHSVDQQSSTSNEQLEFVKDKLNQVYGIWGYYEDLRKQVVDKKNKEEAERTEHPKVGTSGATHQ